MVVFPDPFMHHRKNTFVLGLREKIGSGLGEDQPSHLLFARLSWTDFEKARIHGFKTLEGALIEASLRRIEELVEPSLRFIKLFTLVDSFRDEDLRAIVHVMGGYIIVERLMEKGGTGKTIDLNPRTGREKYPYELFWFPYDKPPRDLDPASKRVLEKYKHRYKKKFLHGKLFGLGQWVL